MIRFTCECCQLLDVPDDSAGKKARCPKCEHVLDVPTSSPSESSPHGAIQAEPGRETRGVQADPPETRGDASGRRSPGYARGRGEEPPVLQPAASGKAIGSLILGLLSVFCLLSFLAGLPGLILGALALGDVSKRRATGGGLAIAGILLSLVGSVAVPLALTMWAIPAVRNAAARAQSQNNLKQMALAMHSYHDANGFLPQQGMGPGGRPIAGDLDEPLMSWRVAILPYIEQNNLYNVMQANGGPWNSPGNEQFLPLMPKLYKIPGKDPSAPGMTYYQGFSGPGALFERGDPIRLTGITDGTSNTLLIVEAATEVPWTKPEDVPFKPKGSVPPLGGHFKGGFNAAFADGSVRFIPASTPPEVLKAMITRNGGEVIPAP